MWNVLYFALSAGSSVTFHKFLASNFPDNLHGCPHIGATTHAGPRKFPLAGVGLSPLKVKATCQLRRLRHRPLVMYCRLEWVRGSTAVEATPAPPSGYDLRPSVGVGNITEASAPSTGLSTHASHLAVWGRDASVLVPSTSPSSGRATTPLSSGSGGRLRRSLCPQLLLLQRQLRSGEAAPSSGPSTFASPLPFRGKFHL